MEILSTFCIFFILHLDGIGKTDFGHDIRWRFSG